ncbi:MAG TPA: DEAD/DEAH box helicase, partial [Dermatophilaceae bacterium]|nr:DEAD/DEAH box helicase [Dermatophilaceae bacterium]
PARDDRPRWDRDDRPAREDRPRFSRDRDDRPRFSRDRDERPARPVRPAGHSRDERILAREDRPFVRRDERFDRGDERRGDRAARGERTAYRPEHSDRRPREFDRGRERTGFRPDRRPPREVVSDAWVDPERERMAADTWTSSARRPVATGQVEVGEDNGFAALGLPHVLVERLARDGITAPFPIQEATIPDALAGRDVLGRGQTGSGKTLAFGLPTLTRLLASGTPRQARRPRALVLVPTRELAMQVSDALEPLVHVGGLRHKLVAGGLSYTTQISALQRGIDLLIATPGRLIDLIDRGAVDLGAVEVTILDEADHMAEMGFLPEVTTILDQIPAGGQRLLFSATLDNGVDSLVERYLTDPVTHSTDDATASVSTMRHFAFLLDPQHKKPVTAELANRPGRTIVFVRTKLGADRVATQLRESGVLAASLHGGLSQSVRNRVLGGFRDGTLPVLVATDVAARGIHVDDVSLVLQVDPPADHKDYLHRSGRTARAGEEGSVVTLVLPHQRKPMERLLGAAGVDIAATRVSPGSELVAAAGGRAPSGEPISDEALRHLLEGDKAHRRGPSGPRGGSHGGPRGAARGPRAGGQRSYAPRQGGPSRRWE